MNNVSGLVALSLTLVNWSLTLREKRPNTDLFLVRIFLYSARIQENTDLK